MFDLILPNHSGLEKLVQACFRLFPEFSLEMGTVKRPRTNFMGVAVSRKHTFLIVDEKRFAWQLLLLNTSICPQLGRGVKKSSSLQDRMNLPSLPKLIFLKTRNR